MAFLKDAVIITVQGNKALYDKGELVAWGTKDEHLTDYLGPDTCNTVALESDDANKVIEDGMFPFELSEFNGKYI